MTEAPAKQNKSSYGRILEASSIVGGAEAVSALLGLARMKFAAVLIGTVGVGLAGTYLAVQSLIQTLSGLGLQTSAVRDVASAAPKDDQTRVGETVRALRRLVWITGLLGAISMAALSSWLSEWTFGSGEYSLQIAILGLAILFANIKGGQMALIQGMRRIGDLARVRILTGVATTGFTIFCYWRFGMQGIVPALVGSAFLSLCVSTIYAKRVTGPQGQRSWRRTVELGGGMISLGLAFMWTALLTAFVAYVTRALINHQLGLTEVGLFTAAFTLSGVFVNFVLNAMAADYYPRLTAAADDHGQMRRLVNEQTEIGMLLAVPGLLFMLALAPVMIWTFYSSEFIPAVDLLRWFLLGCIGRVISWPMGFIMLAQGQARLYATVETGAKVLHLGLVWAALHWFGLEGTAIAYALLYGVYLLLLRWVAGRLIGFSWSTGVRQIGAICALATVSVFLVSEIPNQVVGISIAVVIASTASVYCSRALFRRLDPAHRLARIAARMPAGQYLFGVQAG